MQAVPKQYWLKGSLGYPKEEDEGVIMPSSLSHPRIVFMVSFVYHPDSIVKSLLRAIVRICSTLFLKAACKARKVFRKVFQVEGLQSTKQTINWQVVSRPYLH